MDETITYRGIVYDLSDYLEENSHPGGIAIILDYIGKDVTVYS